MAVSLINIGTIANDGTGDDLREAFIKVNSNFEELDLRQPESTTASNLGSLGEGVFSSKVGNDLQFKKIVAGDNTTLSVSANAITINSTGGLQSLAIVSDSGSTILEDGDTLRIQGGNLVNTTLNGTTNTLLINSETSLITDNFPQLSANLNAQNQDITNIKDLVVNNSISNTGTTTSNSFVGPLQGLVYGVDIRDLNEPFESIDFGGFVDNLTNWIDYILFTYDVDLGTINDPAELNIDLGTFA